MSDFLQELIKTNTLNETHEVDDLIKSICYSMIASLLVAIPIFLGVGIGLNWMLPIKIILFILCSIETTLLWMMLWTRGKNR